MNEAQKERKSISRSMLFTVIFSVVLLIGATIGWYMLAAQIEAIVDKELVRQNANGNHVECEGKSIRGFPFRVGPWCENTTYENLNTGLKIEAGQLRTAAQFYKPGFGITEIDGPANITNPRGEKATLNWQLLRASTRIDLSGIKRLSLEMKDGNWIYGDDPTNAKPAFSWDSLQFHGRPGGGETDSADLETAISINALVLGDGSSSVLPVFTLETDGVLKGVYASLLKGRNIAAQMREEGLEIQVHRLIARFESGGLLKVSGPISIDTDGLLSGKAEFEISEFEKIAASLEKWSPNLRNTANTIRSIGAMLGGSARNGVLKLPIVIHKGTMRMGFIPLGSIPPLF